MHQHRERSSAGNVALQLLIILVVLGTLAATAVIGFAGSDKKHATHTINFVLRGACGADAKTVETAASALNALSTPSIGVETVGPGSGEITVGDPSSYAHATQALRLIRGGFLTSWPTGPRGSYAISLSTTIPGNVTVYVPANSKRPGVDFEIETSSSGCNRL